jgi:putative hydrolase of the HAD superfamily
MLNHPILNGIHWVWVDLDDTLWDFTANSHALLRQLHSEHPECQRFDSADSWVDTYEAHNQMLWREYAAGNITRDFLMTDRFKHPFLQVGFTDAEAEALSAQFSDEYLSRLGKMSLLVPGARQTLEELRLQGFKIGILSNGFREVQHNKLRASGIDRMIDLVVLSDDIGVNKPDRRLFDYAVEQAHTTPTRCLMIGDNPDTDIAGAIHAGWRALHFNRRATPNLHSLLTPSASQ